MAPGVKDQTTIAGDQARNPLAVPLDLTGLGPQVAVDLADGPGELLGVGLAQLVDP